MCTLCALSAQTALFPQITFKWTSLNVYECFWGELLDSSLRVGQGNVQVWLNNKSYINNNNDKTISGAVLPSKTKKKRVENEAERNRILRIPKTCVFYYRCWLIPGWRACGPHRVARGDVKLKPFALCRAPVPPLKSTEFRQCAGQWKMTENTKISESSKTSEIVQNERGFQKWAWMSENSTNEQDFQKWASI